jgi:hypothetical protein
MLRAGTTWLSLESIVSPPPESQREVDEIGERRRVVDVTGVGVAVERPDPTVPPGSSRPSVKPIRPPPTVRACGSEPTLRAWNPTHREAVDLRIVRFERLIAQAN